MRAFIDAGGVQAAQANCPAKHKQRIPCRIFRGNAGGRKGLRAMAAFISKALEPVPLPSIASTFAGRKEAGRCPTPEKKNGELHPHKGQFTAGVGRLATPVAGSAEQSHKQTLQIISVILLR
jgi:hypothetical protein